MKLFLSFIISFCIFHSTNAQAIGEYFPKKLPPQTIQIIDSTLSINGIYHGVFVAYGLSGAPAEQYTYWQKSKSKIQDDAFFNLKNHPSPIIRFYAYHEIISRKLVSSNFDFIMNHIDDVETVAYSSGCVTQRNPLIHFIIPIAQLTKEEKNKINQYLLHHPNGLDRMTASAIVGLETTEENYSLIKRHAKEGTFTGLTSLLYYKKSEDKVFFQDEFQKRLSSDKYGMAMTARLLKLSIQLDFPKNSVELLIDQHNQYKANGTLNQNLTWGGNFYEIIVASKHPSRATILEDVLQIATPDNSKRVSRMIRNVIKRDYDEDLLNLRVDLWEKYSYVEHKALEKLAKKFPQKVFELSKKELEKLKVDNFKFNQPCLIFFLNILIENNEPIEQYINWALQSNDKTLPFNSLKFLRKNHIPSSKPHLLKLLDKANHMYRCRDLLMILGKYHLTPSDKKMIQEWYQTIGKNIKYKKSIHRPNLEEILTQIGISLKN